MTGVRVQDPPSWVNDYVGLPWAEFGRDRTGCDCWGLVRLALSERFGLRLPAYSEHSYEGPEDVAALADLIAAEKEGSDWIEVACRNPVAGVVQLGRERPGDVVLMRRRGAPVHVGLVVSAGYMLHVEEGVNAICPAYYRPGQWRQIEGFYRHRGLSHAA